MGHKLRRAALWILVLIGVLRPLIGYVHMRSEEFESLSVSPMIYVFSTYHFFTRIRFAIGYHDGVADLGMDDLFHKTEEAANIYSGKQRYSLIFMNQVLGERMNRALAKYYFCDDRIESQALHALVPIRGVEIRYESRITGKVLRRATYSCL